MNKKAFTLVELLIVISILSIMVTILVGILNPIAMVNKGRDARRKKDLNRIRVAFEEYFNDKGCYPSQALADKLMIASNCNNSNFLDFPWLKPWPCDPTGRPYQILVDYTNCPKWFKVMAVLENKTDKDILPGWELGGNMSAGFTGVNYGVSSGNISPGDFTGTDDPYCVGWGQCYEYTVGGAMCNKANDGSGCIGSNCYLGECSIRCKVSCCGSGCE